MTVVMRILCIVTAVPLALGALQANENAMESSANARDSSTDPAADHATHGDWYQRSWIHSHISIGPPPEEVDFIGRQIKETGLDAVQFHCTGGQDLWKAVREVRLDETLGFRMVATINAAGGWRRAFDSDPAYIYRIHPDGGFAGRWEARHLCFNAPVVRERIIPEYYQKLPARLKPDQVWIDENIITVNLCWCEHCKRLYRKKYGSEPPTELTQDNHGEWTQWVTFHRASFERWMEDVRKAVDATDPQILVTFNHAWFVEQPETPPPYIKNLSADIHKDPLELGIYARYGGSSAIPFDLMPGLGDDIWAGVHPKSLDRVLNDIALIIAHGGRWNIGEFPTNYKNVRGEPKHRGNGRRPADVYLDLARQGAEFSRKRQSFCQHSRPVPYVALLHSASTHYDHVVRNVNGEGGSGGFGKTSDGTFRQNQPGKTNSRVYWPNNHPIDESLVGAYQALLENHVHFNFTIEDRLANDLKDAALLVLPEQHRLAPESVAAIQTYVRNGGRLLATGSTRSAGLDALFDFESHSPRSLEKGRTVYLPENFFGHYAKKSGYSTSSPKANGAALREQVARILETLLPANPYTFDAPPWFEWTLRRNAEETEFLVHVINRKLDWKLPANPPAAPLRCSLALGAAPDAVTLEPGGERLKWKFTDGRLVVDLHPAAVAHHRIIRIVRTVEKDQVQRGSRR